MSSVISTSKNAVLEEDPQKYQDLKKEFEQVGEEILFIESLSDQ